MRLHGGEVEDAVGDGGGVSARAHVTPQLGHLFIGRCSADNEMDDLPLRYSNAYFSGESFFV